MPSLDGPLGAEGDLVWKAEKIALELGPVDLNSYIPVQAEAQTKSAGASGPGKWSEDKIDLSGTLQISKGIVSNSDLFMASPLFRVTGKDTADMPKRTVDYRVNPKAVADARGQGGDTAITGIAAPVLIIDPLARRAVRP